MIVTLYMPIDKKITYPIMYLVLLFLALQNKLPTLTPGDIPISHSGEKCNYENV